MTDTLTPETFAFSPLLDPRESGSAKLVRLYDWWLQQRNGAAIPAWSDIDVIELKEWMGWLTVYGILPDRSDAKFRLVGTRFAETAGLDLTGRMLSAQSYSLTPAIVMENLRRIIAHGHACVQQNQIAVLPYDYLRPSERLWLPFAEPGQPVDRVLLYYHKVEVVVPIFSTDRLP
jgi:hypothetical protein